jgi:hypothetical protein
MALLVALVLSSLSSLQLLRTQVNTKLLNGAAQAKIYREIPDRLFVTARGSTQSPRKEDAFIGNASLTVLGRLTSAQGPLAIEAWHSPYSLEGQDLSRDKEQVLVVTDLARGMLLVFNSSRIRQGPIGTLNLTMNHALHVRLFLQHGHRYALITSGEATVSSNSTQRNSMFYADVTDPRNPRELGELKMNLSTPEGVQVHQETSTAYFGGCDDTKIVTVDLSPLPAPPVIINIQYDDAYKQMVSTPNSFRSTAWFALYGPPIGGIARFDVDSKGILTEKERFVDPRLVGGNRVDLTTDPRGQPVALLPLEHSPVGGMGVIRLSPTLMLDDLVIFPPPEEPHPKNFTTRCFCAAGIATDQGSFVHAFVGLTSTLHTYSLL